MMPEPTPQPPLNPDPPQKSWWRAFADRNQWYIDKAILTLLGLVIAWGGYEINQLKDSAKTAAEKATAAEVKADAVQTTALKTQVQTDKILVNTTDDPKDKQALAESKAALAEHQAATREAANQAAQQSK